MQALHDVVTAGYVRYIGISICRAWQCTSVLSLMLRLCPDTMSSHVQSISCKVLSFPRSHLEITNGLHLEITRSTIT